MRRLTLWTVFGIHYTLEMLRRLLTRACPPLETFKTLLAKRIFSKVCLCLTRYRVSRILKEYSRWFFFLLEDPAENTAWDSGHGFTLLGGLCRSCISLCEVTLLVSTFLRIQMSVGESHPQWEETLGSWCYFHCSSKISLEEQDSCWSWGRAAFLDPARFSSQIDHARS